MPAVSFLMRASDFVSEMKPFSSDSMTGTFEFCPEEAAFEGVAQVSC
jgi:hypothetical protein